jgi:hypothetical protein
MNTIGFSTVEKEVICRFVNLGSMHSLYRKVNDGYLDHIPLIGELSQVVFHIFLLSQFDEKFRKQYPKNPFYRLGSEVILPIPDEYEDLDIDPSKLLAEFNLFGSISEMESDEAYYLPCTPHERLLLTLTEGEITVWRAEDF